MIGMQLGHTSAVGLLEVGQAALGIQAQLIVERNEVGIFCHTRKPLPLFPAVILQWTALGTPAQSGASEWGLRRGAQDGPERLRG